MLTYSNLVALICYSRFPVPGAAVASATDDLGAIEVEAETVRYADDWMPPTLRCPVSAVLTIRPVLVSEVAA